MIKHYESSRDSLSVAEEQRRKSSNIRTTLLPSNRGNMVLTHKEPESLEILLGCEIFPILTICSMTNICEIPQTLSVLVVGIIKKIRISLIITRCSGLTTLKCKLNFFICFDASFPSVPLMQ